MTYEEKAKAAAQQQASIGDSCGLDTNIYGEFTLGIYDTSVKPAQYFQLKYKSAEAARNAAKNFGFVKVFDRIRE